MITKITVKNLSAGPVDRLQIEEFWYDNSGNSLTSSTGEVKATFFKTGETYTVDALATKDGSHGGWIKDLKFPDGKIVTIWYGDPNAR